MNPSLATRYPAAWRELRVGEMMHSKMPLHRLEGIKPILKSAGVSVRFEPSPTGYYVVCTARKEVA